MLHQLLVIKAYLYLLLITLLIVAGGVAYTNFSTRAANERAFCGNVGMEPSNPQYQKGKMLFVTNCASCHSKNMKDKLTGSALGPALEYWSKYPASDLYDYIRDNQKMVKKRHPRAVYVWKEYAPTLMPAFKTLTDAEITDLLAYIKMQYNLN
jgi:mono/diheme cytochrome c family protein